METNASENEEKRVTPIQQSGKLTVEQLDIEILPVIYEIIRR